MRVLVLGATGVAGRPLAAELVRRGHDVHMLSRSGGTAGVAGAHGHRGDLLTGDGLEKALTGIDVVADCVNIETVGRRRAERVFVDGTRRLLTAEHTAGVRHHVLLSIVGVDVIPYPYYKAKLHQEQTVTAGPVPATVLRATPFHEFTTQVARRGRVGPFVFIPRMRTAPIAVTEVAHALADVVEGEPVGRAPDITGPLTEELPDLVRRLLRAREERAWVVPVALPGRVGRLMRGDAQSPGAHRG